MESVGIGFNGLGPVKNSVNALLILLFYLVHFPALHTTLDLSYAIMLILVGPVVSTDHRNLTVIQRCFFMSYHYGRQATFLA